MYWPHLQLPTKFYFIISTDSEDNNRQPKMFFSKPCMSKRGYLQTHIFTNFFIFWRMKRVLEVCHKITKTPCINKYVSFCRFLKLVLQVFTVLSLLLVIHRYTFRCSLCFAKNSFFAVPFFVCFVSCTLLYYYCVIMVYHTLIQLVNHFVVVV